LTAIDRSRDPAAQVYHKGGGGGGRGIVCSFNVPFTVFFFANNQPINQLSWNRAPDFYFLFFNRFFQFV
jgi:hypothetical protein